MSAPELAGLRGRPGAGARPCVQRYTLPLAAVLGALLGFTLPNNPRLEDATNRSLPSALDPRIAVIAIDDVTLRDYGTLGNWSRDLYVQAFSTLRQAGARASGLDVVLGDAGAGDAALNGLFSQPNVVLANPPGDAQSPLHPDWLSPRGVSALSDEAGPVRAFQTAYPANLGEPGAEHNLIPSFARQLAAQAGRPLPLSTAPQVLRYSRPEDLARVTYSFRDLVQGNVRYADLQGKVVVIGQNATGAGTPRLPDVDGRLTPGLSLQARAVSSLLVAPFWRLPAWLTALLCLLTAVAAVALRGLWGYALAGLTLALAFVLWRLNVVFPGVTVSLAAVLGAGLVAFERWWQLRDLGTRDTQTGLGTRLAFTRAAEHRWHSRQDRPLTLLLLDIGGLRRVSEVQGHQAAEQAVQQVAGQLQKLKRRSDLLFRWGSGEFAMLLAAATPAEVDAAAEQIERQLGSLRAGDLPLRVSVGVATTHAGMESPTDLIEEASRNRYRAKYRQAQDE